MVNRLHTLYLTYSYHVRESAGCLLVGFKPHTVSFIVKEVWNTAPLTKQEAEACYAELMKVGVKWNCRYFRIVAYGGYLPEALAFELHGLTVSDATYLESLSSGRHVELFPHNETAYRAIEEGFKRHRIGAVVQATGTGKSFLLARYIASHPDTHLLVIAPNVTILEEIRSAVGQQVQGVTYRTFQALVRRRGKQGEDRQTFSSVLKADHILIDEFHHFGAEVWGEAVREVIEANPEARVLGTSATPIRPEGMIDTVDVYFEGNLFYELTLPQAWYYGILPIPVLVQSVYGLNGQLDKLQAALDRSDCSPVRRERIQKKLDAARVDFKSSLGAPKLIRQFLPASVYKLLVFCRDKADLREMVPEVMGWLAEAGREAVSFEIHNEKSEKENRQTLDAFRQDSGRLHVLFSINMLIEGLHVEGVDAALFLRRTESYIVTLQQLGRCLKAGSKQKPVVLDFVNNLSGKSVYDVMACDLERLSTLHGPRGFEGAADFEVTGFFSDIRRQVEAILSDLEPWQIMYERLLEYHAAENDWPSVTEGKLGLWCNTQRIAYKRGSLPIERCRQLDAIGFEWDLHDSRWTQNYTLLQRFRQEHSRWPKRGEGPISTWCNTQRQMRKNGKLTKERIHKLDAIGFVWEQDPESEWHRNYEKLKTFHRTHKRFPKAVESCLGAWCCTQRKMRRQNALSADRIACLDALGFPWSPDQVWQKHFEELASFWKKHRRWPTSREGKLGSWCFVQRKMHRNGQLTEERIRLLEGIRFWDGVGS